MTEIQTEITINASVDKVWMILTDFDSYKKWNPFIQDIQGKSQLDERLIISINPPGKKRMVFKPKITSMNEKVEFSWAGNLLIPGIFDGHHKFLLKELPDHKTQLIHSEFFSGILKKPIFNLIKDSTRLGFEQMNQAFKNRCEI